MKNEPVAIWATLGVLIGALLRELVPDMSNDLVTAIVDAVVVLGPALIGIFYARSKVVPLAKLDAASVEYIE